MPLEMLRVITEVSFDALIVHEDGVIVSANGAAERMYRAPPGGLAGRPLLDLVAPQDRELAARRTAARDETPIVTQGLRLDGTTFPIEGQARPVPASVGSGLRVVCVRDLSPLHESESRFRAAFHANPLAMGLRRLADDVIVEINGAFETLFDVLRQDVLGKKVSSLPYYLGPEERRRIAELAERREPVRNMEARFVRRDGEPRHVLLSYTRVMVDGDECLLASFNDVTERRLAEERLTSALAEKETLLREVHHRVKNNLQVITGLLHFQSKKASTPAEQQTLEELRRRILAMRLVHERLYQSGDVSRVDFGQYVHALVEELGRTMGVPESQGIRLEVAADPVQLPIELALPSAMVVSELVTNVLKYAFPGGRSGLATVSVRRNGDTIELCVEDDGVGFPAGFDFRTGGSFGWELIRTLALQLGAAVETRVGRGTHVCLTFTPARGG